ncbi:CC-NBS-LRR class disease resistance protein, putative isoform 1 [Hibiscus syriacus]|uniref:CC-NBS-LRR class disease resistance protein, putative isoform 1 n=1 Tax=Hibiscus syriacus TaxID=106335 RepID=A0A6A3CZW1_HIBSY|nr:CC-NBS-LRR class disease resistance protein, putative isoform 1 [Hibiscus syriacus]
MIPSHGSKDWRYASVYFELCIIFIREQIMCRRRVFDAELEMDRRILYHWACKCIENGQIYSIIDPYLKGKIAQPCLKKFLEIAYGCVQFEVNKRPTMGEVEATLNGEYKSAR